MEKETLNFGVTLNGTFWNKRPQFSIWLDDSVVVQSELPDDKLHTFKFIKEVTTGEHTLKIRLENKTNEDVVKSDPVDPNYTIVKDMLLNIDDITIADISLDTILWDSTFILDQPIEYQGETISKLDSCVNLGSNGTYILKFSSPFYIWLLEKL